ncbi:LOW QUALITY PROTEIN: hypothetical protein ACRRTK_013697 [Alexandromys fortis]
MDDLNSKNAKLDADLIQYRQDLNEVIAIKNCQQKQLLEAQLQQNKELKNEYEKLEEKLKGSEEARQSLQWSSDALQGEKGGLSTQIESLRRQEAALQEEGTLGAFPLTTTASLKTVSHVFTPERQRSINCLKSSSSFAACTKNEIALPTPESITTCAAGWTALMRSEQWEAVQHWQDGSSSSSESSRKRSGCGYEIPSPLQQIIFIRFTFIICRFSPLVPNQWQQLMGALGVDLKSGSQELKQTVVKVLLHVLFEHAVGYALLSLKEVEEISLLQPQVALENANAVSEGVVHEDLRLLLETYLPSKKKKVLLGVGDPKIGAAIQEELGYNCQTGGVIAEVLRGVRLHFHNLVKGLTDLSACKAQLGLGHSYSRAKVKFNVNRVDNMIIQSISLLDQLDKDINTFSMRVREWYGYHFPELVKIINDNATYCRLAQFIGNRRELNEEKLEKLEELTMDGAKAKAILDASRSSMVQSPATCIRCFLGMDISAIDLINIESFSSRVVSLSEYRQSLHTYLRSKMSQVAPSLSALIGEAVGARLIAHAGSLTNLAKYPASTVQILGAEKALFRALKTRGNTPKYGLIFHSTFIGRAAAKNKGRISRYLANKCSIASRIDCFSEVPTSVFGEKLREQVEERLSFYETGEIPRKNLDVMKEAMVQAEEAAAEIAKKLEKQEKKRLKKEKKRLAALAQASSENSSTPEECEETHEKPKKKKKLKPQETPQENGMEDPPVSLPKSKKKKAFPKEELASDPEEVATSSLSPPKRKKSSPKEEMASEPEEAASPIVPKKKRKFSEEPEEAASSTKTTKKKKKSQKASQED